MWFLKWVFADNVYCIVHTLFPVGGVLLVKHMVTKAKRESMARDDYYCSTSYGVV